ncbi:Tetratricopeptide repeat-containing protein [Tangfeifania diversioriginum]|uniref:Tetratricopeptide repeat-containing protein n=1 Tax=Tangfeifania diversioriginum TaxID=1168035 RepID=A0A1M6LZE0_9BACT|nr:tetratricopeptide repeat protein [Tangfeifania diversioriginum]SHJ76542.1 Tetratricopeptide repeat-containing protein [Tangfeifania diversioriginum]
MRTIRILVVIPLFLFFSFPAFAQQTDYFEDISERIQMARELYRQEKYNSAYQEFDKITRQVDPKSEIYSEAQFYKAVSALKSGLTAGYKMVDRFIEDFPESPYLNRAWFNLGSYQFERKHYAAVLRSYAEVDQAELDEFERVQFKYQNGYSHLMMDNEEQALAEFEEIKDANNIYSRPASYYWAHIMYLRENYQSALEGFSKLDNDPTYSRVIPLYVSHIYYKQEKYQEVVDYTVSILDDVEEEHRTELSKIVGDSWFHLREYEKAIPYLETYYETSGPKTREDNYILGYCYYTTENYEGAVPLLENASKGKDEMAQNAYYHLADAYVKVDEKEKARVAFEAASELDFNERIKEDALFSYAKLTYELSYSPFNETIKAFDRYIELYPNSERNSEAYRYLTEVFMVTRNYQDAISSIEKIENKTPSILRAYQRVTFFRGLELFNNLAYNQAIDYFDISLSHGSHSREINARALYWKAEALFRVGDYNSSIAAYSEFLRTPGAFSLSEFRDAEYNLGYAYFKLEDYQSAGQHFRNYINAAKDQRSEKLADAYNRVGDYYFLNEDYTLAKQNYQHSLDMNLFEPDYALYQIAFCQGLLRQYQAKINSLERLQTGFPDSEYADDALFELGRANERLGNNTAATQNYRQIINNHAESNFYRKALLQMGLINYNSGNFSQAVSHFKNVVENFRGSSEAQTALMGIKNCYVEMNNVDEYFAYTNQLGGGVNVTTSEQDSMTYMAAERLYMSQNDQAASQLSNYLRQFPNGSFATNSHFYLAELLYKEGEFSEANEHYTYVAQQPNNIFSEQALSRASELTFNANNYAQALELFNQLERVAGSKWNNLKAYTGQMRCNFELENYQAAISAAQKVKNSDVVNEAWMREANFISGKSHYLSGNHQAAIEPLKAVATDTKLEQGAEAKFLISEIYYNSDQKQQAEEEIMDFIAKGTPFQFWLGKSFLLLADIYIDRGDDFQAKHTLRSVVENYGADNDGVKERAAQKLAAIEAQEQKDEQNARDSSFQLEFNDN